MANLYITEQGSVLRKTGNRLIVQKDEEVLLEVKCKDIDAVLLFGNVQFTTQAVHELFEHGIEMALLTKTGRLIGQITSPVTKNIELRVAQFRKYDDAKFILNLSRVIVASKITNSLNLVKGFSYNHKEIDLSKEITRIHSLMKEIENTDNLNTLRGVEGIAARTYFKAFGKMMLGEFAFEGRNKRPPKDPVNALLSFGYTLIFNEISSLLDGLGFDPYLGYFHVVEYGRASLASDIQEEFRSIAERFTLYLVNNNIFTKQDFYVNPKSKGIYLKRESMKRYFTEYERYLSRTFIHHETGENTNIRKCFRIQAEKLAHTIKEDVIYRPFELEI